MVAFTPSDPSSADDRRGTRHADYIFNRVYLNAVIRGFDDRDVDGLADPGERRPDLRGRADFIGLNYYFRSRVTGLTAPASTTIPLFDFLHHHLRASPEPDGATLPDHLHGLRLGDLSGGIPPRAEAHRQLRQAGVRDRERPRGRRRRSTGPYLVDHLRRLRAAIGGRGRRQGLLRLVAWTTSNGPPATTRASASSRTTGDPWCGASVRARAYSGRRALRPPTRLGAWCGLGAARRPGCAARAAGRRGRRLLTAATRAGLCRSCHACRVAVTRTVAPTSPTAPLGAVVLFGCRGPKNDHSGREPAVRQRDKADNTAAPTLVCCR